MRDSGTVHNSCFKYDLQLNAWSKLAVTIDEAYFAGFDSHPDWGLVFFGGISKIAGFEYSKRCRTNSLLQDKTEFSDACFRNQNIWQSDRTRNSLGLHLRISNISRAKANCQKCTLTLLRWWRMSIRKRIMAVSTQGGSYSS